MRRFLTRTVAMKYYAVRCGYQPGIYNTWKECLKQVCGFKGSEFKSFTDLGSARAYLIGMAPDRHLPMASGLKRVREIDEVEEEYPQKRARTERGTIVVYTDGSCLNNGTDRAVAGVGVYFGEMDPRNVSEPLPGRRQTNQRAEITAAIRALEVVHSELVPGEAPPLVLLYTDSNYVVQAMTSWILSWRISDFRRVANADLFRRLDDLSQSLKTVSFAHCPAHAGIPGNEEADRLARSGCFYHRSLEK